MRRDSSRTARPAGFNLTPEIAFSVATALFVFLVPTLLRLDRAYLLCGEGWVGQTFALSVLSGIRHRMFETPKPLWNVFWLLSRDPAQLYVLISLMVGLLAWVIIRLSKDLFRSRLPGVFTSLIILFSFGEYLATFVQGGWTLPYLILLLLALHFDLTERPSLFAVCLLLSGMIRPESWVLTLFFVGRAVLQRRFKPVLLIPWLAPLVWLAYDWRISGNPLYSFQVPRDYARYTSLSATTFLDFWPTVGRELKDITGIPTLVLGVAGLVCRVGKKRVRAILGDPVLALILLPVLVTWLLTLHRDLYVMGRFFPATLCLAALAAFHLPYSVPSPRRRLRGLLLVLPLLAAAPAAPSVMKRIGPSLADGIRGTKTLVEGAAFLNQRSPDQYRSVMIPMRRYAAAYRTLNPGLWDRLVSYRELLVKTDYASESLNSRLPALALWIGNDEIAFPAVFGELWHGAGVTMVDESSGTHYRFDLVHRTPEEGGFVYVMTADQGSGVPDSGPTRPPDAQKQPSLSRPVR